MKQLFFVFFSIFFSNVSFSQAIILDPSSSGNALIDGQSTNKGLLPPRMTTAQRVAIQNPERGLIVYDRNVNSLFVFNGYDWGKIQIEEGSKIVIDSLRFYGAVAVENNYMAIGCIDQNDSKGAVHVFKLNGSGIWQYDTQLVANDRANYDYFGNSISIKGGRMAVGALGKSNSQGAVYIFELLSGTWLQRNKLVAPDGVNNDNFGASIGLSGNRLIVGAPNATVNAKNNAGKVYIFNRTTIAGNSVWFQTLLTVSPDENDYFGSSVAINNDEILIGARGEDFYIGLNLVASNCGSVSWYKNIVGTWTLQKKIIFTVDGLNVKGIGSCVAIDNDIFTIGSPIAENPFNGLTYKGIVVIINKQTSEYKFVFNSTAPFEAGIQKASSFPTSLILNGNNLLVGAFDFDNSTSQGAFLINTEDNTSYTGILPIRKAYKPEVFGTTFGLAVGLTASQVLLPYLNISNGNSEIMIEDY